MRSILTLMMLALFSAWSCNPEPKVGADIASPPPIPNRELDDRAEVRQAPPEAPSPVPARPVQDVVQPHSGLKAPPTEKIGAEAGSARPTACTPDCLLRACGPDGCGGICGVCADKETCREGRCVSADCIPDDCTEISCGTDGCGGTCGRCPAPEICASGKCRARIGVGLFGGRVGTAGDGIPRSMENLYLGFPAAWSGPCDYGRLPRKKADRILARNPAGAVLLTLLPECGFESFSTDFSPGSRPHEAVKALGADIAALGIPVIVRIAPHMNAPWFPWGPCVLDNKDGPCLGDALKYRDGFANIAKLLREHGGPHLSIAWTPLAEPAYWRESIKDYPTYEDFYPGDALVDYVGLDISWNEEGLPPEGAFDAVLAPFYAEWASPEGRGRPMILAEVTANCRLTETVECVAPAGNFESIDGWWGPWGRITLTAEEGAASGDCDQVPTGEHHLLLAPTPDETGSINCPGYYVGGLSLPLNWGEGVDLSRGDALRLRARKGPVGTATSLQIEVCDTTAPACSGEDRCCPAESVTTTIVVDAVEWRTWTIPFEDFSPSLPGSSPAMDWGHVRALKLHVLCPDERGPMAPLHLDGFGISRTKRPGEASCDERRRAWARQVYAPDLCDRYPNLKLVLWKQAFRRTSDAIFDGRIRDAAFWRELWEQGECFTGTWW